MGESKSIKVTILKFSLLAYCLWEAIQSKRDYIEMNLHSRISDDLNVIGPEPPTDTLIKQETQDDNSIVKSPELQAEKSDTLLGPEAQERNSNEYIIQYSAKSKVDKSNMNKIIDYFNGITSVEHLLKEAHEALKETLKLIIKDRKKVILLDMADIENKGDMSINIGEFHLLSALNLTVVYYCPTVNKDSCLNSAYDFAQRIPKSELVVMIHGGGNIGYYSAHDKLRLKIIRKFHNYKLVQLSQSVNFQYNYLKSIVSVFQNHPDFTMILRDRYSFEECIRLFPKLTMYLAPDMVFNLINQKGFAPPLYNYVRMKRLDGEKLTTQDRNFHIPSQYSQKTQDWRPAMVSPQGKDLVDWSYMAHHTGLLFLQKGQYVVTDRLHGYILTLLMHKPAFVIDNSIKKISHYLETWCMGLRYKQWTYWNFSNFTSNKLPLA